MSVTTFLQRADAGAFRSAMSHVHEHPRFGVFSLTEPATAADPVVMRTGR